MQRPVVTAVPLKPPVVHQDAAIAPFEADLIRRVGGRLANDGGRVGMAEGVVGEIRGVLKRPAALRVCLAGRWCPN
jgi:hypothetical protein